MTVFKELGLKPEIVESISEMGFTKPSPVQEKVIPFILNSKKDLIALAQTGTGKTAAYGLPILNQIKSTDRFLQAIILCPTRELCIQLSTDIKKFAKHSKGLAITAVYGGERIDLQIRSIKQGTDIIVGTPGRVHDLIRRKILKLQSIKWLVLDEADEMLDMGFKDDLDAILEQTSKTRRTLLFSATMSKSVHSIAKQYMTEAEEISIGEKNIGAENVTHEYYVVQVKDRFEALKRILDNLPGVYGILFCRTRNETQTVANKLELLNYNVEALHGEISQTIRTKIMARFKRKEISLLVATDVAARGIDVSDLTHVINYNLPDHDEAYTHRSGRTGRAQSSGISISILGQREVNRVSKLEAIIGKKFEYKKIPNGKEICLKQIDNFIEEIENADTTRLDNKQHLLEITERLKKINKEDLIKHVVAHKFGYLMEAYKDAFDINTNALVTRVSRKDEENFVSLKINLGRKNGFDIKKLFSLINSNGKLKGIEIGRIGLMSEYSIFSVDQQSADRVKRYLHGTNYRGQEIKISEGGKATTYQGKRTSRTGRSDRRMVGKSSKTRNKSNRMFRKSK